jgi:hypothetical protein
VVIVGAALIWFVPATGAGVVVRVGALVLFVLPAPLWSLARTASPDASRTVVVAGAVVGTTVLLALSGFVVTNWLSIRWTTGIILAVCVLATLLSTLCVSRPEPWSAGRGSGRLTAVLVLAIGVVAVSVHLSLPSVPVESAYSLSASSFHVSPAGASTDVTIHSVNHTAPRWLALVIDGDRVDTVIVGDGETRIRLSSVGLPAGSTCASQFSILASNGTYLSPPVTSCVP